jgi:hypothetical protein
MLYPIELGVQSRFSSGFLLHIMLPADSVNFLVDLIGMLPKQESQMVRKKAGRSKGARSKGYFHRPNRGWFSIRAGKFVPHERGRQPP